MVCIPIIAIPKALGLRRIHDFSNGADRTVGASGTLPGHPTTCQGAHGSRRLHQGCPVPSPWVGTRLAQRRGANPELSSFEGRVTAALAGPTQAFGPSRSAQARLRGCPGRTSCSRARRAGISPRRKRWPDLVARWRCGPGHRARGLRGTPRGGGGDTAGHTLDLGRGCHWAPADGGADLMEVADGLLLLKKRGKAEFVFEMLAIHAL